MDSQELSRLARARLGCELRVAEAREPLDPALLSPAERSRLDAFALPRRREEWLRGRAALKAVLRDLGLPDDTSALAFPHPRVTLTHSGGLAFAAGLPAGQAASGIGLDYETRRPLKPGVARFFLSDSERARLGEDPAQDDLLRLWTVKEALFKANPGNREGEGRYLARYALEASPADLAGRARAPGGLGLGYVSLAAGDGFLSLAVADGSAPPGP